MCSRDSLVCSVHHGQFCGYRVACLRASCRGSVHCERPSSQSLVQQMNVLRPSDLRLSGDGDDEGASWHLVAQVLAATMTLQCGLEGEAIVVMNEIFRGLESRHVLMLPWPLHHITQSMAEYCKRCACPSTLSKRCLRECRIADIWVLPLAGGEQGWDAEGVGQLG